MIINKLFRAIANIQLCKFRLKEGAKLVCDQSHKLISFMYSKLCEASLWPITLTSFQIHPNSRFLQMSFNPVWSTSVIAPTAVIQSGGDTERLMAVQNSFPKGAILDSRDASKANYFAADKDKSLICRVFIKADMVLFCVYAKFLIIYFQMIFYIVI